MRQETEIGDLSFSSLVRAWEGGRYDRNDRRDRVFPVDTSQFGLLGERRQQQHPRRQRSPLAPADRDLYYALLDLVVAKHLDGWVDVEELARYLQVTSPWRTAWHFGYFLATHGVHIRDFLESDEEKPLSRSPIAGAGPG